MPASSRSLFPRSRDGDAERLLRGLDVLRRRQERRTQRGVRRRRLRERRGQRRAVSRVQRPHEARVVSAAAAPGTPGDLLHLHPGSMATRSGWQSTSAL